MKKPIITEEDYKEIEEGSSEITVADMYGILIVVLFMIYFCVR